MRLPLGKPALLLAWTKGTHAVKANCRIRPRAKFFFEGEKKFFVKGVTYGPFKPDADGQLSWPAGAGGLPIWR